MSRFLLVCVVSLVSFGPSSPDTCLRLLVPPVDGPVTGQFAPEGRYAGHWGVDLGAADGTPVGAVAAGTVVFAGEVVGVRSVSVDHGGGVRSTVSWLETIDVGVGARVVAGDRLGTIGGGHAGGLHLSVRLDGVYVDPEPLLGCTRTPLSDALSLVP